MCGIPGYLYAPSTSAVAPPVDTTAQLLPFGELHWEDFERLCLRLAERDGDPEHCQLYGERGQAQGGIDIYARRRGGGYVVYQSRRVRQVTATKIKKAVDDFLEGEWRDRASRLVFCTSASLTATKLANAAEKQAVRLRKMGKSFVAWDCDGLSRQLKDIPGLVIDFFSRAWAERFCGREAAAEYRQRLDVRQVQELRQELSRFYGHVFARHDAGALLTTIEQEPPSLAERFVVPDVIEQREVAVGGESRPTPSTPDSEEDSGRQDTRGQATGKLAYRNRLPLDQWLARSTQHALVGGPGSGKSSAIRFLALDLLSDSPRFEEVAARWKTFLPVWIPFAYWVSQVASGAGELSLSEAVRKWLLSFDEQGLWPLIEEALSDERLVLLVDGLDEWSNPDAAGIALDKLHVFVARRNTPLVATSRPVAFERLGSPPRAWAVGRLASLSRTQQIELVARALPSKAHDGVENGATKRRGEAVRFIDEIERATDLRELVGVPLLLLVLLWLHRRDAHLPEGRFAAYSRLVDFLVVDYPQRRRRAASVIEVERPLSTTEIKNVLTALGFTIHQAGGDAVPVADAEAAARNFLADEELGPGLDRSEARRLSAELVREARDVLGLLVEFAPASIGFFHRSLQEHLAAAHMSTWPFAQQLDFTSQIGADAHWREVILNLVYLTQRADETDQLVKAVRDAARTPVERLRLLPLLTEIAVGSFGCSTGIAREIVRDSISKVETGASSFVREAVLTRLIPGLDAASVRGVIRDHMRTWLPCVQEFRADVLDAIADWPLEDETEDVVWRAIFDEQTATARAAARTYVKWHRGDPASAERFINLLAEPLEPRTRAVAFEALAEGWPSHDALTREIALHLHSADPDIRLVAHTARIKRDEHDQADLDGLLRLGSEWSGVDFNRKGDIGLALVNGWPRNESIKKKCLSNVERVRADLVFDLAHWILLAGYGGDQDVVAFCRQQIERGEYPDLTFHFDPWVMLARNFQDEPTLVDTIDNWINTQAFNDSSISFAALVGRTQAAKKKLISLLSASNAPFWAANALLEGWGMEDSEVSTALLAVARGSASQTGLLAQYLPRILTDRVELAERLLVLLADSRNGRPAFALRTAAELGDPELAERAVGIALERDRPKAALFADELDATLIEFFPSDPRVRLLASAAFGSDAKFLSAPLAAVARGFASDPEMRSVVRSRVAPLPAKLRETCARRLGEGIGETAFALELLDNFLAETNPAAASEAARAWARRRRDAALIDEEAIARADGGIVAIGPFYMSRRQAALVALSEFDRVDRFADAREDHRTKKPATVPVAAFSTPNLVLAESVVEHWGSFVAACGPDFLQRLGHTAGELEAWDVVALFADQSEAARDAALAYIEHNNELSANLLRFYAAVNPRSESLLDLCLRALRREVRDHFRGRDFLVEAAETLGEHFGGDEEILRRISKSSNALPEVSRLLALAEGWPESDELRTAVEDARARQLQGPLEAVLRVRMAISPSERAVDTLREHLEQLELNPGNGDRAVGSIVRRLRRDPALAGLLATAISDSAPPREIASVPRLLAAAGALAPETRTEYEALLDRALEGDLVHLIGLDIVEGRRRPVAFALADAIGATPI